MGRAGYGKYPPQSYAWASRPAAADWEGEFIRVTDVGLEGSLWISNGSLWVPANGGVILAQSGASVTAPANDTNENTLATISIKGGVMGLNGALRIYTLWTVTNSGNNKTQRIKLGVTTFSTLTVTAVATVGMIPVLYNRNSAASQVCHPTGAITGTSGSAITTGTIDTSADANLTITAQKATGTELIRLEAYTVELITP